MTTHAQKTGESAHLCSEAPFALQADASAAAVFPSIARPLAHTERGGGLGRPTYRAPPAANRICSSPWGRCSGPSTSCCRFNCSCTYRYLQLLLNRHKRCGGCRPVVCGSHCRGEVNGTIQADTYCCRSGAGYHVQLLGELWGCGEGVCGGGGGSAAFGGEVAVADAVDEEEAVYDFATLCRL